jgi:hypothetical protein
VIAALPRVRRPERRREFHRGAALGIGLPLLALVVIALLGDRASAPPPPVPGSLEALAAEREALRGYGEAVDAAVHEGGFVVTQGMKPGIADIAEGAFPDATLVTMASGWVGSMEKVRSDLSGVRPPAFLLDVARRYDEALGAYVKVGKALIAAAEVTGAERAELIEKVPPLGQKADDLWDAAHVELERHRVRLGLAPAAADGGGHRDAGGNDG